MAGKFSRPAPSRSPAKPRNALAALPVPPPQRQVPKREAVSVEVRRISNGYLVRRSVEKGNDYRVTETFTPKRPQLEKP